MYNMNSDYVIFNCGHHPAASEHYSMDRFDGILS